MERIYSLLIGYVFGLFQTGYIIGRIYKTDIREHGSGNAGTTNALRTFGKKAGALTLLGDCLKCMAAIWVVKAVFGSSCADILPLLEIYAGAGCILGHNFPFYLRFRGGKGVASTLGLLIAFDWRIALICGAIFLSLFFLVHYVSLASLTAYTAVVICMIVFGQLGHYGMNQRHLTEMYIVMGLLTVLAFLRHKKNISRLAAGEESKVFLGKKK